MARFPDFRPEGVIPACLLPFEADYAIDEQGYRKHLQGVVGVRGITAITVNAHASEAASCSDAEQERVLALTLDEVGDRIPVVNGIYADGSHYAARLARMAARAGASCLLVFPPNPMAMGGQLRPEMALAHFRTIADACDLPIILFQYPMAGGLGYPLETLLRLVEEVPQIRAIKDWCNDAMLHERHIRVLQSLPRPVTVLSTHSSWLLSSLVMGCGGLLSGAGSVIADLQVALFKAVQAKDLARAQAINRRIYPLAQAFYAPPFLDMHNRMKETLVLLGRMPRAVVRPPLMKLGAGEIERLRQAIAEARLGAEGALDLAA
jgi:4-hydroxy-tetrahydrodipicolinate synthase